MKWHDKKDVVIISSEFGDAMQEYLHIFLFLHTNRLYCQLFIFSCSIYYEIIYSYITI